MYRLSYSRLGNISFIALVTISYFVPRSHLFITYLCLYLEQKPDYILNYLHFEYISK